MSASPMARKATGSQAIPTRKVLINDLSELPSYYSSTPGGTLYSTTPGGTKIVYEKSYLLNLRNSPISKTPPNYEIPTTLLKSSPPQFEIKKHKKNTNKPQNNLPKKETAKPEEEDQFSMDL